MRAPAYRLFGFFSLAAALAGCSADGLIVFDITLDARVGRPDLIEITAGDRMETYDGRLKRMPGLRLSPGTYRVSVIAIRAGREVGRAREDTLINVLAGQARTVPVHIDFDDAPARVAPDAGMPPPAQASPPLDPRSDAASPEETAPELELLKIVRSFPAPGTSSRGIGFDGAHLWLIAEDAAMFELDAAGASINALTAPIGVLPRGVACSGPGELLIFDAKSHRIHQLRVSASRISSINVFRAPGEASGEDSWNDLAWDGVALWYVNRFKVYRLNLQGEELAAFPVERQVAGVDWDGERLWLATAAASGRGVELTARTADGVVLQRFAAPITVPGPIAWGRGDRLWTFESSDGGSAKIHEIDMSRARAQLP